MANPKNILLRMPNWIGDAVMAAPVIEDLKVFFPQAKLTALCQGGIGQLFTRDPYLDEIIAFQKPNGWIPHLRISPLIEDLRKGEFDTGLLLTNSFSSAWWFFRGQVKNRIGFSGQGRSFLLNHAVSFPSTREKEHLVSTYKHLLAPLGVPLSSTLPKLYVTVEEKRETINLLRRQGVPEEAILVGINPGAAFGSAKCWLPERFHEVAKELLKDPKVWILIFGDAKGRKLTESISAGLGDRVLNLAGKTSLRELMAHVSLLKALLTNDSGPMHVASALKVPLVALFGSTSDVKTGPFGNAVVINKHVECSPCYRRVCPIDFRCMTRIEVEEVAKALKKKIYETS